MGKTGYFVGNDAGHIATPCERRVKAKYRANKGKIVGRFFWCFILRWKKHKNANSKFLFSLDYSVAKIKKELLSFSYY